jgi:DNA-binding transcriptional MerR regulator
MERNVQYELSLPDKDLFRIGEVSRLTATKQFVLRYWETEFPTLQPVKSPKGHRLYRRQDVDMVFQIKRLLYDEGFTIAGARRHLNGQAPEPNGEKGAETHSEPRAAQPSLQLDRKLLLDLRDSLRQLLTVLESE